MFLFIVFFLLYAAFSELQMCVSTTPKQYIFIHYNPHPNTSHKQYQTMRITNFNKLACSNPKQFRARHQSP